MPSTSVTLQPERGGKRRILGIVLNDRRHCSKNLEQSAVMTLSKAGNARSPIVESRVIGTASAEVDDERRRCRPGSPATGCTN